MKNIDVGLLWHSMGSANLGVGALTVSQVKILNDIASKKNINIRYHIFCWKPEHEPQLSLNNIFSINFITLRSMVSLKNGFLTSIKKCDIIIDIGEGDSFSDIYGFKRFIYLFFTKLVVVLLSIPLILAPQTIGPYKSRMAKKMAAFILNKSSYIFARDSLSFKCLRELGVTDNADEAIDVAFKLPYIAKKHEDVKKKIGLNVSALLFNGGYTNNNMFGLSLDYKNLTHNIIKHLLNYSEYDLYLVPHVISESLSVEDDYIISQKLQKQYPKISLAPRFSTPEEAKSFISTLDVFIGARMHSCIAAFSSGVPVIPLAYSRKFSGLFGDLDYDYVGDLRYSNEKNILKLIADTMENLVVCQSKVDDGNFFARRKLTIYELVLESYLDRYSE